MALVTVEVTWLWWLLEDFGVSLSMPTPLLSDSTGAISMARDLMKHELSDRTTHRCPDFYSPSAYIISWFCLNLPLTIMLFFIRNSSLPWLWRLLLLSVLARGSCSSSCTCSSYYL